MVRGADPALNSRDGVHDVAIIGTGLAGTILATLLARRGLRVILVEKGVHPRFAVGESTIPHTSLLLSILAERYDVPELDHLAYPDQLRQHVASSCGIKRSFGFAFHRRGKQYDPAEGFQFGTASKDENHFFRQDTDAYMLHTAVRYGADLSLNTSITKCDLQNDPLVLHTQNGPPLRARFLVDASGHRSLLASTLNLRTDPNPLLHHSRSLFTHMVGLKEFAEEQPHPLILPWRQSTLHHVFPGGWFWVIPFNNQPESTNPLISVGLTVDPRQHPRLIHDPEQEFHSFLEQYPSVQRQFASARAVRPWVATGRLQYSSRRCTGERYCLLSHAAGFIDPLFSRGLINSLESIQALMEPLCEALADNDFSVERFAGVEALQNRVLDYNDRLVSGAFESFSDFDLFNAWLRVWALGTILAEFRIMNALTDFTGSHDLTDLAGESQTPVFSRYEDPDYAAFFELAWRELGRYQSGEQSAAAAARQIFSHTARFDFPVQIRRDAMRRAGWLSQKDVMSDRSVRFAREGYRWALTNPNSRDLFGCSDTLYRWRAKYDDPHLVPDGSQVQSQAVGRSR
jgi:FADH2 O2-dependent halogenase